MKETLKSQFKSSIASIEKSKLDNIKKGNLWDLQIKTDGKMAIVSPKADISTQFRMIKAAEGHWKIVEIIDTQKEARAKSRAGAAYRRAAKTYIEMLGQALDSYRLDIGKYPTTGQGLDALMANTGGSGWDGPYLKRGVPNDPWGRPFHYQSPGNHGEFDLISYGADGAPGGEGENKDVTSWE